MPIRIPLSRSTVKDLHRRLQHASPRDDVRLVRRSTVLLDLLVPHVPVEGLSARWGLSGSCMYGWRHDFLRQGVESVVYHHGGGRQPKRTPTQRQRLIALMEAGPLVGGFATAGGTSVLLRVLSWRACGVLYHRHEVWTGLHNGGFALPTARWVSDPLDEAQRLVWLEAKGPALVRAAQRRQGLILFADEARLALWGSWSYPWARRGQQPEVPTSGTRKGSKVFGAIAYFAGRLFSQGIAGRLNAEHDQRFLPRILDHTTEPLLLIHAGARYHTSASTQAFWAAQSARITEPPWPSYSPDDHPIAYLWRKTKKRATHNKSCKEFAELTVSVDKALAYFATHPDTVLGLFGRYREESGLELKQAA